MVKNKLHLLLADDDDDDRFFFGDALSEINAATIYTSVKDGEELADYFHKTKTNLPDIIFLDLNMPKKGGMECLKEIRANHTLENIFVIIYSTSVSDRDVREAYVNGANLYLEKPCCFDALKNILSNLLSSFPSHEPRDLKKNFIISLK
jgi:DNA-binding response OmpR family regulator